MLEVLAAAPEGLLEVFSGNGLLFLFIGTVLGLVMGVLPGIGGPTAIALLIPVTYGFSAHQALLIMSAAMGSVTYGGAITAILVNVPGSPVNIATCFDGYPLAQKGKAGIALGISAMASTLGGIFGLIVLVAAIPLLRYILTSFGPPEYFVTILFGLLSIPLFTKGNLLRGLFAGVLGVSLAFVGYDTTTGHPRFTLGAQSLYDGIQLIPMLLGVFAISEAIHLATSGGGVAPVASKQSLRDILQGAKAVFRYRGTFFRSSVIGTAIGILPGMGGVMANTFAWIVAAQFSRNREKFGTGELEGIVASETANNAKDGGSLLPTLAFGIPGSAEMAVLLGAFILHGVAPGPDLLKGQLGLTWTIIFALLFATIIGSTAGMLSAPYLARVTSLPGNVVAPIIVLIGLLGAYATRQSGFDIVVALVFGFFGHFMTRFHFPKVTFLLGFILGGLAEYSFHQSLMMSDTGPLIFVQRPIALTFLLVLVFSFLFTQIYRPMKARRESVRAALGH